MIIPEREMLAIQEGIVSGGPESTIMQRFSSLAKAFGEGV